MMKGAYLVPVLALITIAWYPASASAQPAAVEPNPEAQIKELLRQEAALAAKHAEVRNSIQQLESRVAVKERNRFEGISARLLSDTRLWESPSYSAAMPVLLDEGDEVLVYKIDGDFATIKYGEGVAFIRRKALPEYVLAILDSLAEAKLTAATARAAKAGKEEQAGGERHRHSLEWIEERVKHEKKKQELTEKERKLAAKRGNVSSTSRNTRSRSNSRAGCCKTCKAGKACGNSCISKSKTCHKPPGCACNG